MTPSNLPWRPGKQARSSRPSAGSRLRRWLVGGVVVGCAGSALNVTLVVTSASGTGTALSRVRRREGHLSGYLSQDDQYQ